MPTPPPNALKHGAFSTTTVLPGESIVEFDALHARLVAHLMPEGDLETDAVLAIARLLWRKERLHRLRRMPKPSFAFIMDPRHPRYEPGKWTYAVKRSNMPDAPPPPPYTLGSSARPPNPPAEQTDAPAPPEATEPDLPTLDTVMEDFEREAKLDAMIDRSLRKLTRLQSRRQIKGERGRPDLLLPLPEAAQIALRPWAEPQPGRAGSDENLQIEPPQRFETAHWR